jgi:hypothetical protein
MRPRTGAEYSWDLRPELARNWSAASLSDGAIQIRGLRASYSAQHVRQSQSVSNRFVNSQGRSQERGYRAGFINTEADETTVV